MEIEFTAEDEGEEYEEGTPEQTEAMAGSFVIFDTNRFCAEMNCLAIQVTDEGGVYLLDAETHKLRALELDDGKSRTKLSRVQ